MLTKLREGAFGSAYQKIKWAEKHVNDIKHVLTTFHERSPNTLVVEDALEIGQVQCSLNTEPFLRIIPTLRMLTGDAIHNMRCALDHLAWTIVSAFKEPNPRLYFPMDVQRESFVNHLGFREIQSVAPDVADLILNDIKPYGTGNPFVALNQLDRADKHRSVLVHAFTAEFRIYMAQDDDDVPDTSRGAFILVANPTRVPRPDSRAWLHNNDYRSSIFDIRFDPGLPFENEPVIPALHQLSQAVSGVVEILTTHCIGQKRRGDG
jgi:hypothetical protein